MQDVSENIPSDLQPRVEAALAWFNASADAQNQSFKVTGIIDPDEALAGSDELRLILCGAIAANNVLFASAERSIPGSLSQ